MIKIGQVFAEIWVRKGGQNGSFMEEDAYYY